MHSWMHNAIKSHLATDAARWAPCQELLDYLTAPLEDIDDVVAWWGVRMILFVFSPVFQFPALSV